jgi:hypothetical protein
MFEVLLQADRALGSGDLDQAERSYWQLVELDPTNAIAVAGLARVCLQRGDSRLARTFADRALEMDPAMAIAKRIRDTITGASTEPLTSDQTDLPLLAAQRLEALGRRRAPASEEEEPDRQPSDSRGRPPKSPVQGDTAGGLLDSPDPAPVEPPPERRQGGRLAAAAAAAGAAAELTPRSQTQPRYKVHQALGDRVRRNLPTDPQNSRRLSEDPFAAAESAAAIEAVDQTDDVAFEERAGHSGWAGRAAEREADPVGDALGAVDARGEQESIAMRLALMADTEELPAVGAGEASAAQAESARAEQDSAELDSAELDSAELDAAELGAAELGAAELDAAELEAADTTETEQEAAERVEDVLGVAELVASEEFGALPAAQIDLDALEAQLRAAEERASARGAGQPEIPTKRDDQDHTSERPTTRSGAPPSPAPLASDATEAGSEADPAATTPDPTDSPDPTPQPRRKGLFRRLRGD